jgi:HSP20 family protein
VASATPRRRRRRFYGSFSRAFTLPKGADVEQIRAELKRGVLPIAVPKTAAATPQEDRVQSGEKTKS